MIDWLRRNVAFAAAILAVLALLGGVVMLRTSTTTDAPTVAAASAAGLPLPVPVTSTPASGPAAGVGATPPSTPPATPAPVSSVPATTSSPVLTVDLQPGPSTVRVTWEHGSSTQSALVQYSIAGTGRWMTVPATAVSGNSAVLSRLATGAAYDVRVSVTAADGQTRVVTRSVSTLDLPGAPTGLRATRTDAGGLDVAWQEPEDDGGSPVAGYVVSWAPTSAGPFAELASTDRPSLRIVNARQASFVLRVSAVTAAGEGPASTVDVAADSASTEASVAGLSAVAGSTTVSLTWARPAAGAGVADYDIAVRPAGGAWQSVSDGRGTTPGASVTGLTNGTVYEFRVAAVTSDGRGSWATVTATPYTVPGAPSALAAAPGADQVTLTWAAPAFDGGRPVTGYVVEHRVTGAASWIEDSRGTSTRAAVTGLANGVLHDFRVRTVNVAGTSGGAIVTASPVASPGNVGFLSATPGDAQVGLTWTAPDLNGGSPVTDYVIEYRTGSGAWTTFADGAGTGTAVTVTGLVNGVMYDFRVTAVTAAASSAGAIVIATPQAPSAPAPAPAPVYAPGAPTALVATPTSTQVAVSWTAPAVNGGAPVLSYVVTAAPGGASCTATAPTLTCTVTGLANGTAYSFTAVAVNVAGASEASAAVTGTPLGGPDAPTGVTATASSTQVDLSWTAPVADGGSPILSYTVTAAPGGATCTSVAPTVTCTVTGLTDGTSYSFTVAGVNAIGTGTASAAVTETPFTIPDAPTALAAVASSTQVALTWTAPSFNGGRAVTDYVVEYRVGAGAWTAFADGAGTGTSATVTGLTNGTAYEFRVSAVNTAGTGAASATASETPFTIPDAPTALAAVASSTQVALTWTAPVFNGGRPVTDYLVEYRVGAGAWTTFADGATAVTGATVTGLTNGTAYEFRVSAVNAAGTGTASATATETPFTVPDNVGALGATPGNAQVALAWTAPAFNGGRAITDYVVEYRIGAAAWTTFADGAGVGTSATVTGLVNGTAYDFRVTAVNIAGASAGAIVSDTPFTTPDASTALAAVASSTQVALTWTAPVFDGGRAITDYIVEYRVGAGAWTTFADGAGVGTSTTVTGLTNGTAYEFRVSAVNAAGTGTASATASETPFTLPDAPTGLGGTPNDMQVALAWTAPAFNGGRTVTDYVVEYRIGAGAWTTFADGVSAGVTATVTGLTNGTAYEFRVSAVNVAGTGAVSGTVTVTPDIPFNAATGGSVTDVADYQGSGQTWRVHTFTSSSTLTVTSAALPFSVVVIGAGGGGGGSNNSFHGGAGGPGTMAANASTTLTVAAHPVTVGVGGAGGSFWGSGGSASTLGAATGAGGGGGWNGHEGSSGNPVPASGPTTSVAGGAAVEYGRPGAGGWAGTAPGGAGWNGVVIVAYRIS